MKRLAICLILLFLLTVGYAANDYSGPPVGLIGLWTFENSWQDSVNSITLSPLAEASSAYADTPAQGSYCADFERDGDNDSAYKNNADLHASTPGKAQSPMTVCAAVRFETATASGSYQFIASKYQVVDGGRSWALSSWNDGGTDKWAFGKGYNSGNTGETATLTHDVTTGVWYRVAASTDESGNWYIASYDGATLRTASGTYSSATTMVTTTCALRVGARTNVTGGPELELDGQIDELSIWNVELTTDEVDALVQGTYPPAGGAAGKATIPSPSNAATGQRRGSLVLSWTVGDDAVSHDVYVGTDPGSLSLVSDNQVGTTYTLTGLAHKTTYYWRIDENNADGDPTLGDTWSFTTRDAFALWGL